MQKWLTQAALRTTDDIIDFSEYSFLFVEKRIFIFVGKQGNWTNKPELRHQE